MAKFRVVVVNLGYESYQTERDILGTVDAEVILASEDCMTEEAVIDAAGQAHAIMIREAPVSRRVLEALPLCQAVVRYGVGIDNIDLEAARERRIHVANVPGYGTEEVSDHAAALLLACVRMLLVRDRNIRKGIFETAISEALFRTTGKVLGLIGYGRIGRALHRKWRGFEPGRVLIYDPMVDGEEIRRAGGERVDLGALLEESDYISLHAPLAPETRHLIDGKALRRMKPTAILVNTARGELVDEAALVDALRRGVIAAAGLDVFEKEPVAADHPILALPNVVLSGHVGWFSKDAVRELQTRAAQEMKRILSGQAPASWVNPW